MKQRLIGLLGLSLLLSAAAVENGCDQRLTVGAGAPTDCPSLHGAPMVRVPIANGGSYCIDTRETTQAEYADFLASGPGADGSSVMCSYKTTFVPGSEPRDDQIGDASWCHPDNTHFDPQGTPDLPVVCLDWCDAAAYCAWAGKRLCGRIGGGPTAPQVPDFNSAAGDEWYRACSNAGASTFPYGSTYQPGTCNDGSSIQPVDSAPDCHGTSAPFDEIFDMSGNVHEWENGCTAPPSGGGGGGGQGGSPPSSAFCLIRGGAAAEGSGDPTQAYDCGNGAIHEDPSNLQRPTNGVRCCAD